MPEQGPPDQEGHVVDIREAAKERRLRAQARQQPGDSLEKYSKAGEDDDYRHRMITNVVALGFLVLLVVAGIWIADTMAAMRKSQDCVLSGRRGCTPVDAPPPRW